MNSANGSLTSLDPYRSVEQPTRKAETLKEKFCSCATAKRAHIGNRHLPFLFGHESHIIDAAISAAGGQKFADSANCKFLRVIL